MGYLKYLLIMTDIYNYNNQKEKKNTQFSEFWIKAKTSKHHTLEDQKRNPKESVFRFQEPNQIKKFPLLLC